MEKVNSINSKYFRLFALGFVIILMAIIAFQIVLQQSINHTIDPSLINKSGRQRTISQRVSKLCLYIEFGIKPASPSKFNAIDSLKKYSSLLQTVHQELITQNNESVKNKEIESLLAGSTPWVQIMVTSSNELINLAHSKKNDSLLLKLAEAEMHFLPNMERITKIFELESIKELERVRDLERNLSIALAVIIIALFLVLFFPILKRTEEQNRQLVRVNKQLEQAGERLIQLNEEKNSFMAMATHDLKNPLNSISGLTNLLSHDQSISKENMELIDMINSTTSRMRDLISRLLDYNKIEQGKTQVNNQLVNLTELIKAKLVAFEQEAHKKEIQLKFEQERNDNTIHSDPDVLAQIFDNLVSNAIKFSKANTAVTITLNKLGKHVVIEITDQGPGIPAEELPRLFVPFTRLSARPTANESSTGLGLSIVKQLVQLLGGAISVDSTVGKGSTFRVALKNE
jgi:signal transduction histidine kinase